MLSKDNAVFNEMYRIGRDWEKAREERRARKQEIIDTKGWDSEELKAWYAEDEAAKFPFSQGGNKAYRAWASSIGRQENEVEMDDFLWERQGYIMTTEGNVVHYGYIEQFIGRLGERFNIREIAFDRWGAVQMTQNLESMGFSVVPFGQGFKDMSPPTKELMKLVLERKIAHGGHPVLRWMMDNIYIRTDPAGNIKADKEKSTEKIDGVIAAIMGLDRAIRCGNDTTESVYDNRGFIAL